MQFTTIKELSGNELTFSHFICPDYPRVTAFPSFTAACSAAERDTAVTAVGQARPGSGSEG